MQVSDERLSAVVSSFQAAAVGAGAWLDALEQLAHATDARSTQLIGFGSEQAVPFNHITELPPEVTQDFIAAGGADPQVNSRVRIGSRAASLNVFTEADFTTAQDMRRFPEYGDFIRRYDIPFICLTNLVKQPGLVVGIAAMRSARQGDISAEARRGFGVIAPHVRAAVLTQTALQGQGAKVLAGAFEALSMAVFVCDAQGYVKAATPAADELAAEGRHLTVRAGRLQASNPSQAAALAIALQQSAFANLGCPPPASVLLHNASGGDPVLLDVACVPADVHAFSLGNLVLVIARAPRTTRQRAAATAAALFGLTRAEANVAGGLVAGLSAQTMAEDAGLGVGTVRTHIRRLLEKAGVRSQLAFLAKLSARL